MNKLIVEIEFAGKFTYVGSITGLDYSSAQFTYAAEYLQRPDCKPISLSLPLQEEPFNSSATKNFFEGLLPEGFMRKCVAEQIHTDENDYLTILAILGNECLGAIRITDHKAEKPLPMYKLLTAQEIETLAKEGATESVQLVTKSHLSLTGASGKVGLYYDAQKADWYFPIGDAPSTHIVKQSHVRLKKIVTNEQLCLLTAKNLGITIPESFIINLGSDSKEDVLFATQRYDRKFNKNSQYLNGLPVPYRLHQEDFAQALGIPAKNKYEKNKKGYLKKAMELLRTYSSEPLVDQFKLWDICIFNYLIGNTDNHIKNISLVYSEDLKQIRLAPAYDIISTMIYDSSTENMALSIGGLYNIHQINKEAFITEAANIGLGRRMAIKRFDLLTARFQDAINEASAVLRQQGFDEANEIKSQIMLRGGISNYQ